MKHPFFWFFAFLALFNLAEYLVGLGLKEHLSINLVVGFIDVGVACYWYKQSGEA